MAKHYSNNSDHAPSIADVRKFSFQSLLDRGLTEAEARNLIMRLRALGLGMLLDGRTKETTKKDLKKYVWDKNLQRARMDAQAVTAVQMQTNARNDVTT